MIAHSLNLYCFFRKNFIQEIFYFVSFLIFHFPTHLKFLSLLLILKLVF